LGLPPWVAAKVILIGNFIAAVDDTAKPNELSAFRAIPV